MAALKHLLDFEGWRRSEVESLLETARLMEEVLERPMKKVPALKGFTIATVFFEPSTRTKTSFELAAKRMSADVVSFAVSGSSLSKGESYKDTLLTLQAMVLDAYVIRSPVAGMAHQAAGWLRGSVINAGDGRRAHPTQALLDAYTLLDELSQLEGKKIAIVGDIAHSRVARSNAELLPLLGADVWAAGPVGLLPEVLKGARLTSNLAEALSDADAVMVLRLQKERMQDGSLPSIREYISEYQITAERMNLARPGALLLHPGPMNRDLELAGTLAEGSHSRVERQVRAGEAVRMAVLYHLLVGRAA